MIQQITGINELIDTIQSKLQRSRPRYQPTFQLQPGPTPSLPSLSTPSPASLLPASPLTPPSLSNPLSPLSSISAYPAHQFRRHKHLSQQLLSLHFHLLIVAGRIAERIEIEGRSLVSKFTSAAPADVFASRKAPQTSASSEKASGAIFVASSRSKSNLASSLTSLSLPSVPNETIAPTSVTQKMVRLLLFVIMF